MPERSQSSGVATAVTGTGYESVSVATRDVHLAFGRNQVLRGIDLEVGRGETACVIGPSGSGKSTLLRTINRLLEPDQGDILLDGVSVLDQDPDALRQRIGMVFQQFNLFPHMTVLRNVTLALRQLKRLSRDEATELALHHLDVVGLRHKADARPGRLSGGQQQRVAIARALAMSPRVMLFDEATSALDPELVKGVLSLMADLAAQGMTMVVVTHEMGFARQVADQVVFMDRGRVVEAGPPAELFEAPRSGRLQQFLSQVL
ncbi:amino acid ABC transporter ATP-binding protein [Plantactinospora sp. S1510]|uniref:Amino acid ABC transporter ATP-binding protein n=1 Tax=Plantactinospora alkalitolerans TaxID=2789879 RepID=A0ABS0GS19_9ACTN|nr:amino acid ABC transporter ATP-binding protein [Plantactinospora alkalitolerans]MBF9128814.1 amino acid ABC transporter ATP-binding protein [Plantactinospora alkalitolerans]